MYDYVIFIGRFQIPHKGHFAVMQEALEKGKKLILAIGSANIRRNLRNPFNFEQRCGMIEYGHPAITQAVKDHRIIFLPIEDMIYTDQTWVEQVQRKIKWATSNDDNAKIALIGHKKDESSYYLNMFPQWDYIEHTPVTTYSATDCRECYYEFGTQDKSARNRISDYTTSQVLEYLDRLPSFIHEDLQRRYKWIEEYKAKWGEGPHYTADAVVLKSGHILLIQRGEMPDIGAWALPGGFVEPDEDVREASLRELKEETGLVIPPNYKHIRGETFSYLNRSDRGRIITSAYCFKLDDDGTLPEVKGSDDARHAEWVPVSELRPDTLFEDHYFIIRKLIAGL